MTREALLLIALQSGALLLAIWGIFRLFPSIPANSKAWIWRLAFLKPLLSLLPFAVITLHILPSSPGLQEPGSRVETALVTPEVIPGSSALLIEPISMPSSQMDPVLAIWLLGASAVAAYGLWGLGRAILIIRSASPVADPELQETLVELMDRAGVVPPINLLASPAVQSAMLVGGLRPTIVLPQLEIDEGSTLDLRLMLAHEIAHIARRDLAWFGVTSAVQTLFFFNPAVWLAAKCSRLDHESATDRYAAQLAGVPIHTYADMLLRATVAARIGLAPGTLRMAASYRTIHRRLEAMKHFNLKPSVWRKSAIAALALVTCGLLPTYQLAEAQTAATPTKTAAVKKPSPRVVKPGASKDKPANYKIWMQDEKGKTALVTTDKKDMIAVFAWNGKKYVKLKEITRAQFEKERGQLLKEAGKVGKSKGLGKKPSVIDLGSTQNSSVIGKAGSGQGVAVAGFGQNAAGMGSAAAGQGSGTAVGGSGQNVAGSSFGGTAVGGSGRNASGSEAVAGGSGTGRAGSTGGTAGQGVPLWQPGLFAGGKVSKASGGSGQSGVPLEVFVSSDPLDGAKTSTDKISVKFNDQDVRTSLRSLFQRARKPFVLESGLQGKVTLELSNVTFEVALKNILRGVKGTFRIEDGVYILYSKGQAMRAANSAMSSVIPELEFVKADVREALREVFKVTGQSYSINPQVQGTVVLRLTNVTVEDALKNVLKQVNASYRVEGGVYVIQPKG